MNSYEFALKENHTMNSHTQFTNSSYPEHADAMLDIIGRTQKEYLERINDKKISLGGDNYSIQDWYKAEYKTGVLKFGQNTIYKYIRELKVIEGGGSLDQLNEVAKKNDRRREFNSFERYLMFAGKVVSAVDKYLKCSGFITAANQNAIDTKFGDKIWNIYVRDLVAPIPLSIDKKLNIYFNNDHKEINYDKTYVEFDEHKLTINLKNKNESTAEYHLKLYCENPEQDLMVGNFIFYDVEPVKIDGEQTENNDMLRCGPIIMEYSRGSKSVYDQPLNGVIDKEIRLVYEQYLNLCHENPSKLYPGIRKVDDIKEILRLEELEKKKS